MDTTAKNGISDAKTSTVDNHTASTEIMQNTAPSYSRTASNTEYDMFYLLNGVTREEYEEMKRASFKSAWRCLDCKFGGKRLTIDRVLDKLNEPNRDGKSPKETNTYFFITNKLYVYADRYVKEGKMNESDFNEFENAVTSASKRYFHYWKKIFENRRPYDSRPTEKLMYDILVQTGQLNPSEIHYEEKPKQSTKKRSTTA